MLDIVIEARNAAISKSMKVKRILPFRSRRMVGPFIFMNLVFKREMEMPVHYRDEIIGTRRVDFFCGRNCNG